MESIRIVDNDELFTSIKQRLEKGETIPLQVSGSSMSPFLVHIRDTVFISKAIPPYKKGDIVFFQRKTGQYVMHRICKIDRDGNLYLIGDGQTVVEGPIGPEQVFGMIKQVVRKGKVIEEGMPFWNLFSKYWVNLRRTITIIIKFITNLLIKNK